MIPTLLVPLFAAMTPFLLWPVELLLPFPYIIEEIAKAILISSILLLTRSTQIRMAIIIGVLFAISESVLYLFNIYLVGDIKTLLLRLLLTIPLHVITTLVILIFAMATRKLLFLGLIIAMAIHF